MCPPKWATSARPRRSIESALNMPVGTRHWSAPHQTGHAAGVDEWAWMNSRGESIRKPEWGWTAL
jgi:hypothetical protein